MNASQFITNTSRAILDIYKVQRVQLEKLPTAQIVDLQHDFRDAKARGEYSERTAAEILEGTCEIILNERGMK